VSGVAERAETAFALFRDLLRIDTTNPPGNESRAAEVVARYLESKSRKTVSLEKEPGRANLVSRRDGGKPGLLLASHLDVVPAEENRWSVPPFAAREADGYIYGRGAIDMKNMAAMCAVVFAEAPIETLKKDLACVFVADEERGFRCGSQFLVEEHPDLVRAETMFGEGGGMTQYAAGTRFHPIGRAEKGRLELRLLFKSGVAGHGSMPHPKNAAFIAAEGIAKLRPGRQPIHVIEPARTFFERLSKQSTIAGVALKALTNERLAGAALKAMPEKASTALRALVTHTVSPTRFEGSRALNVIPDVVTVDLDIRVLPGFGERQVLSEIWKTLGTEIDHEVLGFRPGVVSEADTPAFDSIAEAVARGSDGAPAIPYLIPGMTDASWFSRLGMNCYGFAPLILDKKDAGEYRHRMHGNDERVKKDSFLKGYAMLEDAVLSYLSK
jgi:acetylornithine deacetylase/succinyl-diaminopimelate desuccinylase-like protein